MGNKIFIDDLIIAGSDEKQHDALLIKVLQAAQKYGITFNKDKFQYKLKEIKILGFIVSKDGVRIDPDRINLITELEYSKNKK